MKIKSARARVPAEIVKLQNQPLLSSIDTTIVTAKMDPQHIEK